MKYALVLLALVACSPTLMQQSAPPPGRSARLDEVRGFWTVKYYRLEVSEGVALALTCDRDGPCEKMTVVSDDPAIAEARLASLSALQPVGLSMQTPSSAFVIVGKSPGATKVHLSSKDGTRDVIVTVIAPPPESGQAAAR